MHRNRLQHLRQQVPVDCRDPLQPPTRLYPASAASRRVQQRSLEGQALKQTVTRTRPAAQRQANGRPGPAYVALINFFPLRPLRSARDYDAAIAVVDTLAVRPEGSLRPGEQDYFDTLTMLVEAYDREHHELEMEHRDPLSMLKYVMKESGTTQADLGRLLGNRALASLILNGHRQLSKAHIRKLAWHFKLSAGLFLAK